MNAERKEHSTSTQSLFLRDRGLLEVQGVQDVLRFDEDFVVLSTVSGILTVEGSTLRVKALDPDRGIVTVEGKVNALIYEDPSSSNKGDSRGFFGKLFR